MEHQLQYTLNDPIANLLSFKQPPANLVIHA